MNDQRLQGVVLAIGAYGIWAIAPIYFKALDFLVTLEILAHRIVWALVFLMATIFFLKRQKELFNALKSRRIVLGLLLTTLFIAANWGVFIWSVNNGLILSASLGYFINPLINILFGLIFLKERLSFVGKLASGLCVFAVVLELITFGSVPVIALFLAVSFAFYGLLRKKLGVDSLVGLTIETALLLPISVIYLVVANASDMHFFEYSAVDYLLVFAAGPVTAIPLIFFSAAANRITLSAMGFFQYIAPTGMFLLAVLVYGEELKPEKLLTFIIIWSALCLLVGAAARDWWLEFRRPAGLVSNK